MTLRDLLRQLDTLDGELTIYAEGGPAAGLDDRAVAAEEPEDGSLPDKAAGLDYLLEVSLAAEVSRVWSEWRDGREATAEELHEAVCYYASNDAFLPR